MYVCIYIYPCVGYDSQIASIIIHKHPFNPRKTWVLPFSSPVFRKKNGPCTPAFSETQVGVTYPNFPKVFLGGKLWESGVGVHIYHLTALASGSSENHPLKMDIFRGYVRSLPGRYGENPRIHTIFWGSILGNSSQ